MKSMRIKTEEVAQAIVSELERAREIYEVLANKGDEDEAYSWFKSEEKSIYAKYSIKES